MRTVTSANGYFVAWLNSAFFKQNMHFFYLSGYVFILLSCALLVGQCVEVPMFFDAFFYKSNKTFIHINYFKCTNNEVMCKYTAYFLYSQLIMLNSEI